MYWNISHSQTNQTKDYHFVLDLKKKLEKTECKHGQSDMTLGRWWEWQATEDQQEFPL